MSRHKVRFQKQINGRVIKNIGNKNLDVQKKHLHRFTKFVMEKQALRERYIQLMKDAEKAVGRKEAVYLLRDADIIWQRINS